MTVLLHKKLVLSLTCTASKFYITLLYNLNTQHILA